MKMHKSITVDRVVEAAERHMTSLDNPGFCVRCGDEHEGVDPDARRDKCDSCGQMGVYGADELVIMMVA